MELLLAFNLAIAGLSTIGVLIYEIAGAVRKLWK